MLCALVPIAAAWRTLPTGVLVACLALVLAGGAANRLSALLRPPDLEPVRLAGVPGIRVPPSEAEALPRMVALVQRLVPPGEPVYVAPRRSDLVTLTDPLVHFLVHRPNILRRDALLQARPEEQARIVAALRRARPHAVIRWTRPDLVAAGAQRARAPERIARARRVPGGRLRASRAVRCVRGAGAAVIAVRAGIVVLAIAAIAWLGAGLAATRAQDDLSHLVAVTERPTAAQLVRADALRRDAERWVPGRRASLLEATMRLKGGDAEGAVRLLQDVVRDEPENAEGWLLLARAAGERDPALADRAMARVRALAPEVPPP